MQRVVKKVASSRRSTWRESADQPKIQAPLPDREPANAPQKSKESVHLLKHSGHGSEWWNRKKEEESRLERLKRAYLSGDVAVGPLGNFVETELCSVHHCYHDVSLHRQGLRPCPGSVQAKHFALPRPMARTGNKPTGGSEDSDKLDALLRKHINTDLQLSREFVSSCCDQSEPVPFVTGQPVQKNAVSEQQTEHRQPKPLIRVLTSNACLTRKEPEAPVEDPTEKLRRVNPGLFERLVDQVASESAFKSWNRWLEKEKKESHRFKRLKRAYLSGDVVVGPLGNFVETEICSVHHCYHDVSLHRQGLRPCPGSVQAKHFALPRSKPTGGNKDCDKLDVFLQKHIETDLRLSHEFVSSCCDQSEPVPFVTGQPVQKNAVSEQQTEHRQPKPLVRVLTSNACLTRKEPEAPVEDPAEKLRRVNPELFKKVVDQVASEFCESSLKRWKDVSQFPLDTKPSQKSQQQETKNTPPTTSCKKTLADVKQSTASHNHRVQSNTGKLFRQLKDNVCKMQDISQSLLPEVSKEELEPSTPIVSSGELFVMMKDELQQLQKSSLLRKKGPALQSESKPSCNTEKAPSHCSESKTAGKLIGQLQESIKKTKEMATSDKVSRKADQETSKPAVASSAPSVELFGMLKQECPSKSPTPLRDNSLKHKGSYQQAKKQPSVESRQSISTAPSVCKSHWQPSEPRQPFGRLWQPSSGQPCKDRRDRKRRRKRRGWQPSCQRFGRVCRGEEGNQPQQCSKNQQPDNRKSCRSDGTSQQPAKVTKPSVFSSIPWADRPLDESLDDLPMPQWETDEELSE